MKQLPFNKQQLKDIIEKYPTPFHIYDEAGIIKCVKELYSAFSWNKGFKEFFAVKALPNPYILSLLKDLGCGVDCASSPELTLGEASGMTGHDIMFSSNDTPIDEYTHAKKLGAIINLDDISHIAMLDKLGEFPDTVCCRYNPGNAFSMTNDIMGHLADSKFGMTKSQLFDAMAILKSKGVKRLGIHSMLVSSAMETEYYPRLAKSLFELAIEVKVKTGAEISFINLSGGLGIPYYPDQEPINIAAIGSMVKEAYDSTILQSGLDIDIYTELGRYITGPYGYLISRVLHKKQIYKNYIGLDAAAQNLMRPAMYGSYHHITILGKEDCPCDHLYDVTGSLCENNDKFAVDRLLPNVEIGDIAVIHDTGAHGHSMGYNYNGKLRSAELMLKKDGSVQLIRRAETARDYFITLDFTPYFEKLEQ
ncbi:MAG: diaminopimelate decarboxylase [Clostridiaceae bacterium]|nr:diaminopimelate decarboxylase [Clostridiaceae bacterium]